MNFDCPLLYQRDHNLLSHLQDNYNYYFYFLHLDYNYFITNDPNKYGLLFINYEYKCVSIYILFIKIP